jgi:hypothetical protein
MIPIATIRLTSVASSINFTSIPSTFSHLAIFGGITQNTAADGTAWAYFTFNGIGSGGHYQKASIHNGDGGNMTNTSNNIEITNASSLAYLNGGLAIKFRVFDYKRTDSTKHVIGEAVGWGINTNISQNSFGGKFTQDATVISSIRIWLSRDMAAGSELTLYGIA